VARVRERLEGARYSRRRCLVDGATAWREVIDAIAADPRYGGLRLVPQDDLLPIGRDPASGLFEFVHLGSGERDAELVQRDAAGRLDPTEAMGIVFVLLPGGEAMLGAQADDPQQPHFDPQARKEEQPVHRVRLAPFLVGKYEVTRGQWARLTGGEWPSKVYGSEIMREPLRPVDSVALLRARALLREHGLELPTVAQWEYACRATTDGPYAYGDRAQATRFANFADASVERLGAPWPRERDLDDGHAVSAPVGSFAANPFGLHDMHGNVAEWCDDQVAPYDRPTFGGEGRRRLTTRDRTVWLARGGRYDATLVKSRCALRHFSPSGSAELAIGLRAARPLDSPPP
jgi:formylglycine-generating enzyme required for sulfatase activity